MADNLTIVIDQAATVAGQEAAGFDGVKVTVRIDTVTPGHSGDSASSRSLLSRFLVYEVSPINGFQGRVTLRPNRKSAALAPATTR